MSSHQHSVVVDRPVRTVYDQWTQFEQYPDFMHNVELVKQLGDTMTHWKVKVGGVVREYDAAITAQRPDEIISWHSVAGPEQGGMVTFDPVEAERTRVTLRLDFEPEGFTENVGDAVGVVSTSVERAHARFKDFIEQRDGATGSWRGTIADGVAADGVPGSSGAMGSTGMTSTDPGQPWSEGPGTAGSREPGDMDL
jgi:uncharacterized membrane protein